LCCNFVIDFVKVNEASELSPGDVISSITLKIVEKRKRRKQAAEKKRGYS
jgi:archaellum biogenesis protein FlaJ (TadC family)